METYRQGLLIALDPLYINSDQADTERKAWILLVLKILKRRKGQAERADLAGFRHDSTMWLCIRYAHRFRISQAIPATEMSGNAIISKLDLNFNDFLVLL